MLILKRPIIYLTKMYMFICSLFIGCSKSDVLLDSGNEKSINSLENNSVVKDSSADPSLISDNKSLINSSQNNSAVKDSPADVSLSSDDKNMINISENNSAVESSPVDVPLSSDDKKLINSSKDNRTIKDSLTLESWIGDYIFSEFAPPDQNMFYSIYIYKIDTNYYADINITGFQTVQRLQAKVLGKENFVKLLFHKYLPENLYEPYKEGDVLLSFEKRNSNLYTFWGKLQPMLENNIKSGEVYFNIKTKE